MELSDEKFQSLIRAAYDAIGLTDLADWLGVSKPTILRWVEGLNLPHMALRDPIRAAIAEYLTR